MGSAGQWWERTLQRPEGVVWGATCHHLLHSIWKEIGTQRAGPGSPSGVPRRPSQGQGIGRSDPPTSRVSPVPAPSSVLGTQHLRAPASYLDGGHPDLPPDQDPAVLEGGHVWFLQLHEASHQVGDVHLPVGAEQVAELSPGAGALGHELGEDAHCGVLVLEGAAPAPPLLVIVVLTLSCGPVGRRRGRPQTHGMPSEGV